MARSRSASFSGPSPLAAPSTSTSTSLLGASNVDIVEQVSSLTIQSVFEPRIVLHRPPRRVRVFGAPAYTAPVLSSAANGLSSPSSSSRKSLTPLAIPSTPGQVTRPRSAQHPFEQDSFTRGLMSAGYFGAGTESSGGTHFDISRKQIKARFSRGLAKQNFPSHLASFLEEKGVKKRGEYMIRFIGQQDVHSPFVHLYTSAVLTDTSTNKIFAAGGAGDTTDSFTLWTHLRTVGNTSEWAAKAKRHWPLRVVFEGPSSTDVVPSADLVPSPVEQSRPRKSGRRGGDDDPLSPTTQSNTRINSAYVNHPKREVIEPETPPSATPTILASVKQLGAAVAKTIQPQVQATVQSVRGWIRSDSEREDQEEEEQRERRRARRQARREREDIERLPSRRDRNRNQDRDEEETREEKEIRRAERRRRRAYQQ